MMLLRIGFAFFAAAAVLSRSGISADAANATQVLAAGNKPNVTSLPNRADALKGEREAKMTKSAVRTCRPAGAAQRPTKPSCGHTRLSGGPVLGPACWHRQPRTRRARLQPWVHMACEARTLSPGACVRVCVCARVPGWAGRGAVRVCADRWCVSAKWACAHAPGSAAARPPHPALPLSGHPPRRHTLQKYTKAADHRLTCTVDTKSKKERRNRRNLATVPVRARRPPCLFRCPPPPPPAVSACRLACSLDVAPSRVFLTRSSERGASRPATAAPAAC